MIKSSHKRELKIERRTSTTSESSLEPMDLGRTPNQTMEKSLTKNLSLAAITTTTNSRDSSEICDTDDEFSESPIRRDNLRHTVESIGTLRKKFRISHPNRTNHANSHGRTSNRPETETLSSRNNNETTTNVTATVITDHANNESGFVDASSLSHNMNSSPESTASSGERTSTEKDDVKYVCPICEAVSATPHEFTNHIRCHNYTSGDSENFTCRICSKVLSSASSLDRHVLVHTGERPFNCKYCHLTFTTNGNMHRHMRTHKQHQQQRKSNGLNLTSARVDSGGSGIGNGCTSSGRSAEGGNNSAGGEGESYDSDGCCSTDSSASAGIRRRSSTASSTSSSTINNNNNNNNYKRKSTDEDTAGILKRRIKTTINNNVINENEADNSYVQKFCCPVCNRNDFISMLSLGTHMDREHPGIPAKCRQCEIIFKSHKALNAHRCLNKVNITQGFKDITFVDFSSEKFPLIAKSLCEQTIRTPITSQKFECSKCFRAFPCASAVDIHMKDCGEIAQDFSMRRGRSESCSDEDNRRDEFFAHLDLQNKSLMSMASTMSSPRPSDKTASEAKSETDQECKTPQRSQAAAESKDLADIQSILNVTSSSSSFLKNFEKCVNTPNSEYSYGKDEEEAQDAFTSEFRKMKLRGEFPCKLCSSVFPNLRALKGHNRIHLSAAGAGPFRCNMCPYSIHDKAALIRHMRTHNGDRPYECAVCNYAFTTKANCERHLRNRHAKNTREEVKRAIIYHPSEDSTCDDPIKKVHMFSSPEFDQDDDIPNIPKDRSTPVSHLKEMLQADKPAKIQVKSLEKLIDKTAALVSYDNIEKTAFQTSDENISQRVDVARPAAMDFSMDVLDLSKKSKPIDLEELKKEPETVTQQLRNESKIDMSVLEKNQQLLVAQQQFLNETLPKMDPAHYFQLSQIYRNFVFPPFHPFFLQNSFLPNGLNDLNKFAPNMLMNPMFGAIGATGTPSVQMHDPVLVKPPALQTNSFAPSLVMESKKLQDAPMQSKPVIPTSTPMMHKSATILPPQVSISRHTPQPQPQQLNSLLPPSTTTTAATAQNIGPVKMVIKNGVLMPKQKQRRYRTERPFACDHCSARFTLRSNMERHIKQQHPQYWAQRQRSGHHVVRRNSSAMPPALPPPTNIPPAPSPGLSANHFSAISDQVKYAILAQQLKARKDSDLLQQALIAQSKNSGNNYNSQDNNSNLSAGNYNVTSAPNYEDDDPKLIIDEEDDEDVDEGEDQNDELGENHNDESKPQDLSNNKCNGAAALSSGSNLVAKKVAETILEQAIKASHTSTNQPLIPKMLATSDNDGDSKDFTKMANSMIARAECVGKYLKEVASSSFKEDTSDLVPVSKLVDNATNALSFNNYFRPSDVASQMEQSDEEGLVASGSASESNNSGTEDAQSISGPGEKKKSAYSLAPNRVSCPYCQRMFPWSSSLRRHILTHTGQKPFKCSHCPLLFTTKSNCDRHLVRKHGNVESAVSLYVPIEDIPDPIPQPKQQAEESIAEKQHQQIRLHQQQPQLPKPPQTASLNLTISSNLKPEPILPASDLPFKCHLCDNSFTERMHCLEHIKNHHAQEFALLLSKGAIDTESEQNQLHSAEDDDRQHPQDVGGGRGKYPDYTNRKVICAFCVRRFWSTEDLRRHMRTHSGERPFQCDICLRKFTLKHSMLRHMKKHSGSHHNSQSIANNSGSDMSDDEQPPPSSVILNNTIRSHRLQEILSKAQAWRNTGSLLAGGVAQKENVSGGLRSLFKNDRGDVEENTDLIGNLLGISDQGILNKLLSSADEAAKLLGVDK